MDDSGVGLGAPEQPDADISPGEPQSDKPLAVRRPRSSCKSTYARVATPFSLSVFSTFSFMFFALACAFEIHSQPMPRTYREAMRRPDWRHWQAAHDAERRALEDANGFVIVDPPPGIRLIPTTMDPSTQEVCRTFFPEIRKHNHLKV